MHRNFSNGGSGVRGLDNDDRLQRAKKDATWERLAAKGKQNDGKAGIYMEKVEQKVPSIGTAESAVKNVEDEIKSEIARSLSLAEGKILALMASLEDVEDVEEYNSIRGKAMQARTNLLIQRQACGFKTGNAARVEAQYPIPPAKRR